MVFLFYIVQNYMKNNYWRINNISTEIIHQNIQQDFTDPEWHPHEQKKECWWARINELRLTFKELTSAQRYLFIVLHNMYNGMKRENQ